MNKEFYGVLIKRIVWNQLFNHVLLTGDSAIYFLGLNKISNNKIDLMISEPEKVVRLFHVLEKNGLDFKWNEAFGTTKEKDWKIIGKWKNEEIIFNINIEDFKYYKKDGLIIKNYDDDADVWVLDIKNLIAQKIVEFFKEQNNNEKVKNLLDIYYLWIKIDKTGWKNENRQMIKNIKYILQKENLKLEDLLKQKINWEEIKRHSNIKKVYENCEVSFEEVVKCFKNLIQDIKTNVEKQNKKIKTK